MTTETKATIIRIILTIALLVTVWFHSHWSVALSLSLIFVAIESLSYQLKQKRH